MPLSNSLQNPQKLLDTCSVTLYSTTWELINNNLSIYKLPSKQFIEETESERFSEERTLKWAASYNLRFTKIKVLTWPTTLCIFSGYVLSLITWHSNESCLLIFRRLKALLNLHQPFFTHLPISVKKCSVSLKLSQTDILIHVRQVFRSLPTWIPSFLECFSTSAPHRISAPVVPANHAINGHR